MFAKKDFTNIEALMILYAVKIYNSKRNAAKYLNISLETIDKYLKSLEADLNTKLIISNVRGCSVTPCAEVILKNVHFLKECLQNLEQLRARQNEMNGNVYVTCDLSARSIIQEGSIKTLYQKYPNINLCIDNVIGKSDINESYYDICLSYDLPQRKDLNLIATKEIANAFFASKDYLKNHTVPQTLEEVMKNHRLIVRKEIWPEIQKTIALSEILWKGVSVMNNTFIVNDVTSSGGGIGILPSYLKKRENNLVCLEHLKCSAQNTLYLVSQQSRKDIPKIRAVLDFYKQIIQNL